MKVRVYPNVALATFGVGNVYKQPTKFSCFGTSIAMLLGFDLNESDIPLTLTDVAIASYIVKRIQDVVITGLQTGRYDDHSDLADWLQGNGITWKVYKRKPKNKASVSVNLRVGGGHAIVALGDMGYIDPATGTYSKEYPLREDYFELAFFTFHIED